MRENSAELSLKCVKYMLLTLTMMFILTSSLIISIGTTIFAIYHDLSSLLNENFFSPASLVIVIGVVMLFVSILGCIGALRESTCLVNLFAFILCLVFILEISAAIAAYTLRHGVSEMVEERMMSAIRTFGSDEELQDTINFVQSRLNCCGVQSYEDWPTYGPILTDSIYIVDNVTVPESCCASWNVEDFTATCESVSRFGCMDRVVYLITQSAVLLGTGALIIAFVQLIGIILSVILGKAIRRAKSERARRTWEIQEQIINAYTAFQLPEEGKDDTKKSVLYFPSSGQSAI